MWDDSELGGTSGWGLITVVVTPNWSPQYFFSIRLNEGRTSSITIYSLPKGKKYLEDLIKDVLRRNPCSDPKTIAAKLPLKKRTVAADKRLESVIQDFFSLKVVPQLAHSVRLDATEYDVKFVGDETLKFTTDNFESPVAQWVLDFEKALNEQTAADR